jgi:predicted HTH transcriptional regulator
LGYVEKYGSGINRIKMQVEEQKGVEFRYDEYIFYTEISFIRSVNLSAIDEVDRGILELLETRNKSSELSQALEMSIPAIVKRLNDLVSAGIVIKVGKGKNTQYRLSNK